MWGKVGIYEIFFVILQRILKDKTTSTRKTRHLEKKNKGTWRKKTKAPGEKKQRHLEKIDTTKLIRKKMATFIGNIEGKVDEKGRIFVPATYRKILAEWESKRIVMRRDTDNECLILYPEPVWDEKVSVLRNALDEWDPEDQIILMQFMSDAEFLEPDNQGRVLLQKKNLEMIGAKQDLLFVGMLDRFAIWNPEIFAEKKMDLHELATRIRVKVKGEK